MFKIKRTQINDKLTFAAIFVAFICATNAELLHTQNIILYYFPFAVCALALVVELLFSRKLSIHPYLLWRIAVLALLSFSVLYAIDSSSAFFSFKRYLLQSLVVLLLSVKLSKKPQYINTVIKVFLLTVFLSLVYVYSIVDVTALFEENFRLGVTSLNESWNANSIGLMSSLGCLFTIYLLRFQTKKTSKFKFIVSIALIVFFAATSVLSGSRKSIVLIVVSLIAYLILCSPKHIFRNIVIALLIIGIVLYLLFAVPFLYNHIGHRFEGLFATFSGDSVDADNSSITRQDMVRVGWEAFCDKPLFGYGANCFLIIYNEIAGFAGYAHNNYIEILVDLGLIGFIVYYALIFKSLFMVKYDSKNKEAKYLKAVIIALLVADIGMVSYYDGVYQYILCLILCTLINLKKYQEKTVV